MARRRERDEPARREAAEDRVAPTVVRYEPDIDGKRGLHFDAFHVHFEQGMTEQDALLHVTRVPVKMGPVETRGR